ncbi:MULTISPECIES: anhydro-N-acetylmuramic acid kinase [Methylotenera]|uniref:anhydro-N-acetylmuramic acid kinase n=1 Tax=Methylotenera TaxID=359407 RepID=UPI00035E5920|nr:MULTISPECIES: anhydro-N-acetylmuramic acid kinase [Methylotenera]
MSKAQLFIGIMSGTSLDGIDVALCDLNDAKCIVAATHFLAYPSALKTQLLQLHTIGENELEISALTANKLAFLYAEAVNALLEKQNLKPDAIAAIGCHGQTIRHKPELGFTLQIGNAALLAELTNICVVSDFRSRDIAAGGQGAPLVPAFHQAVFSSQHSNRALVNIGGIANITYLGKNIDDLTLNSAQVLGFDSGPGNMLLDAWVKQHLGRDYDADGAWAASGQVIQPLLAQMLAEPFFALPPPKSTGRDLFNDTWLEQHLANHHWLPQDVARTLVALTARTIHDALARYCGNVNTVYLCGGGAHNTLLIRHLEEMLANNQLTATLESTAELGVGVDWVEAAAFAWLAKQCIDNQSGNLPSVTGAKGLRVLGAIYPA